ncbi:hypothetical protein D3C86_1714580 [compost metagenome]
MAWDGDPPLWQVGGWTKVKRACNNVCSTLLCQMTNGALNVRPNTAIHGTGLRNDIGQRERLPLGTHSGKIASRGKVPSVIASVGVRVGRDPNLFRQSIVFEKLIRAALYLLGPLHSRGGELFGCIQRRFVHFRDQHGILRIAQFVEASCQGGY